MLTKIKAMCLILVLIMLTGLVTAYYHARAHESLLFAIPRISGTNVSAQFLRQASDMGMIVTYENRQATTISVLGNSHNVVLVSTNHDLPFVMGHHIVHGRFFSEYAFKYGHRVAVLNKQAAFALFGSVESTGNEIIMNNIPYIVVGVINDADRDGLNIYVPATLLCDTATAIATNPNMSPTLSKMGILSQWQHMGIDGHNYIFVDFEVLQTVIRDKTILVIAIFLITAMVFILLKTISAVKKQVKDLGFLARNFYLRQVILKPPTWKLTGL
ncbi:MAG: ABC transporter permease, partial [Defluviitaleaceae bacterium]|nr:ABC transporter permease [Defluviitaleaceae bacterium]